LISGCCRKLVANITVAWVLIGINRKPDSAFIRPNGQKPVDHKSIDKRHCNDDIAKDCQFTHFLLSLCFFVSLQSLCH